MLRPDGYVKVLDFGIAKLAESVFAQATRARSEGGAEPMTLVETNLGSILGTVRYMSPEEACPADRGIDRRSEVWSLGVVLYEMVTGHAPFTGDTPKEVMSAIERELPPLTHHVPHLPAELKQIISKTLRKDREERYYNARECSRRSKSFVANWNSRLSWKGRLRIVHGCAGRARARLWCSFCWQLLWHWRCHSIGIET